jgi:CheY-like chemotaxis protein
LVEEKDRLLQSAEQGLTSIDLGETADEEEESILEIDRSHAPQHDDDEEDLEDDDAVVDEVLLLDQGTIGNDAARRLIEFGHRVTTISPEPGAIPAMSERPVCCAAINLAIPSSWQTLRDMRSAGGIPKMPLIAYALAESAPKGFWLGSVDFLPLPIEKGELRHLLNAMVPRIKRVLAMSNDIDVMGDVRTALSDSGISTAVVLDGRQALDLLPTVRPEAAILHLSPTCTDVFRAIAGLRSTEQARDIPILFLMDDEIQAREEAFLSGGIRMLAGRGNLIPSALVDTLASALELYRPDPLPTPGGDNQVIPARASAPSNA